jgi:hypothetical protein
MYELPHFLHMVVFMLSGPEIIKSLLIDDLSLNLAAMHLCANISCYQLPLTAQTIGEDFLKCFHKLQRDVLVGVSECGEGPYDLLARWLMTGHGSLPCDQSFRCLIAFMLGQCMTPPLAAAPSLKRGAAGGTSPRTLARAGMSSPSASASIQEVPPVCVCPKSPQALLDALAAEVLREDHRLRKGQVKDQDGRNIGPLYNTLLSHVLYALAVTVPQHTKFASKSAAIRGAAFTQLMKVQQIVSQQIPPHNLFDASDGKQSKLFLYLRAVACIRNALQVMQASWLSDNSELRINISDEGGRDFIVFCTKHLNQTYTNKTSVMRVLGTPWERLMLGEGPTEIVADLLLAACHTDENLREVSHVGGHQALLAISRYGESQRAKQQATLYLTKLAVLTAS